MSREREKGGSWARQSDDGRIRLPNDQVKGSRIGMSRKIEVIKGKNGRTSMSVKGKNGRTSMSVKSKNGRTSMSVQDFVPSPRPRH